MTRIKVISSPQNKRVVFNLSRLENSFKSGIHEAYIDISKYLKATVQEDFRKPKHGRLYLVRLKGRLVRHRASAAGEPPAILTGALSKTIAAKTSGYTQLNFSAGGGKVNYAKSLEEGDEGRKLSPRPYLIKAINDNERNTIEAFYRNISKRVNKL